MADNVGITPGSGATAAADDISGVLYQRVKLTLGADGVSNGDVSSSNPIPATLTNVTESSPLPVRLDAGPNGILETNNSLQVDATQSNEHSAETLNASNAALVGDEPVQMVGLHPSYPIPIDTATPMPVAGRDPNGSQRQLLTDLVGALIPSTDSKQVRVGGFYSTGVTATYGIIDCDGYQSMVAMTASGSSSRPVAIEWSMDLSNWFTATGIDCYSSTAFNYASLNNVIAVSGIWVLPVIGRYLRVRCGTNASGGTTFYDFWLRRMPLTIGSIPTNQSISISQIGGAAVASTSAQLGVNAFGPSAVAAAHGTNNPVQMSGSDGTNVRRILTDTTGNTRVVGPVAAGTSMVSPTNAAFAPDLLGLTDLEGRVQRVTGDVRGRVQVKTEDATAADDGVIDALNNVVRELKLLNAKITDLPIYLGLGAAMPDDDKAFRDDPTIFNS